MRSVPAESKMGAAVTCSIIDILRLHVHDAKPDGKLNQLGNIVDLQLFHDVGAVGFNRAGTDAQYI